MGSDFRYSIGLVFVFIGMQLNTGIKNLIPGLDIVGIIMLVSVLCLIDYDNLCKIKFYKNGVALGIVLVFQLLLVLYSLACDNHTPQLLIYHGYLIALILALMTQSITPKFEKFPAVFFYLNGFIALIVLYQATDGFSRLVVSFDNTGKLWLSEGGDPITMSRTLVMAIISVFIYKKKNIPVMVIKCIIVIASWIGLFSFGNRATILGAIIVSILGSISVESQDKNQKKFQRWLIKFLMMLVVIYVVFTNEYVSNKLIHFSDNLVIGIKTYFGDFSSGVDASTSTRHMLRGQVIKDFNSRFGIMTMLFGLGYYYIYLDIPLMQAFIDLGCIGFVFYMFCVLVYPLKYYYRCFVKRIKTDNVVVWTIVLISIQSSLDQLYCGLPYYYFLWTPSIMLMFFDWHRRKNNSNS